MITQAEQASLQRAIERALAKEAAARGATPQVKKPTLWIASTPRRVLFKSTCEQAFKDTLATLKRSFPHMNITVLEVEGVE